MLSNMAGSGRQVQPEAGRKGHDPGVQGLHRGPRKGRNIHTGEALDVAPMTLVKFRPSKGLKDAVNPGDM